MSSPRIQAGLRRASSSCVIALLLLSGAAYRGNAQTVAVAEVSGIVTDSSGSAVPNATIRIVEGEPGFQLLKLES